MIFWFLNGLDKVFNYQYFFGEDRDKKFTEYFASLDLPASLAVATVNVFCVMELFIGFLFLLVITHGEKNPKINLSIF